MSILNFMYLPTAYYKKKKGEKNSKKKKKIRKKPLSAALDTLLNCKNKTGRESKEMA